MESTQIWKPVVGFERYYEVSNGGTVRSLPRMTRRGMRGGSELEKVLDADGYAQITLSVGGREYKRKVHRLVLTAFGRAPLPGEVVRHRNANRADNRLGNLSWVSVAQNVADTAVDGHHWQQQKTHCPRGHALAHPNLRATKQRKCLACCRAQNRARRQGVTFTDEMAHLAYAKIIDSLAA